MKLGANKMQTPNNYYTITLTIVDPQDYGASDRGAASL
jgi:hypothetical protein